MVRSRWHAYGRPYPGHGTGRRSRMSATGQYQTSELVFCGSYLSSLLKKVLSRGPRATLIQEPSPKRAIDSRYGRSRFHCCANRILVRVFQQTASPIYLAWIPPEYGRAASAFAECQRQHARCQALASASGQQCSRRFLRVVWKYPRRGRHPFLHFCPFGRIFVCGSIEPARLTRGGLNSAGTLQPQILVGHQSGRNFVAPCPLK